MPVTGPFKVSEGIFQCLLPVPFQIGSISVYLLEGSDGWTMVDCGPNTPEAMASLKEQMAVVGLRPTDVTRVVLTHAHVDHYGMSRPVRELTGAEILIIEDEKAMVRLACEQDPERSGRVAAFFRRNGLPEEVVLRVPEAWDRMQELVSAAPPDRWLHEGESLPWLGPGWTVLWTPGHTAGHLCLYNSDDGTLVSGDHILYHITPHVGFFEHLVSNPLAEYQASLTRVLGLAPRLVLPGHGPVMPDPLPRIQVILEHHRDRKARIRAELGPGGNTGFQVSSAIFGKRLPLFETQAALAETLAHLDMLCVEASVVKDITAAGLAIYRPAA